MSTYPQTIDSERTGLKLQAQRTGSHLHRTNTWNNSLLLQCILGFPVITLQIGAGTRDKLPLLQSAELYLYLLRSAARYDDYDRKGPKVFAGEYASHDHPTGKANNFLAALSEAAFMTGLERNADVVRLATYAPLFAHVDAWQWNPDLIWFDNLRMMRTPNYYVQQMYGMNAGTDVLNLQMDGKPVTGQDSLYASAVLDAPTGEVILKLVNAGSRSENQSGAI